MKTRVDVRLVHEVQTFALAYTCEDCVAFAAERRACAYGYPTEPHRRLALEPGTEIVFCKAFELR